VALSLSGLALTLVSGTTSLRSFHRHPDRLVTFARHHPDHELALTLVGKCSRFCSGCSRKSIAVQKRLLFPDSLFNPHSPALYRPKMRSGPAAR